MASPEPGRDRLLLAAGLAAAFAASAVTDLRVLGLGWLAAALLLRRGLPAALARVLRTVLPLAIALAAASWAGLRLLGRTPAIEPFLALVLRAALVAFVTFSVLARVSLLRALRPWPAASRLAVLTLAQVHALRLVATDSADGLRSRLPRRPGALDVLRAAGGLTAALLTLALRNAREVTEAMRARGFE